MMNPLGTRFFILLLLACSVATASTRVQAQVQDKEQRAIKAMLVWGTPETPEEVIDEAVRQLIAENLSTGRKLPQNQIDELLRNFGPALREYEEKQAALKAETKQKAEIETAKREQAVSVFEWFETDGLISQRRDWLIGFKV